jgi:hypothetical protein
MPARDELASRIRSFVVLDPRITERKMFGGVAFLLNGHILISARRTGTMLAQVSEAASIENTKRPGVTIMVMRGKQMRNFIDVDYDNLETDEDLAAWIEIARDYVATLPLKK